MDFSHTLRALRYRNYRLFFYGQTLSIIGNWIQQIAMAWLVYRMTGSAWLLGVTGFASQIAFLVCAPFGGFGPIASTNIDSYYPPKSSLAYHH